MTFFKPARKEEGQPNSAYSALKQRQPYLDSAYRKAKNYSKFAIFHYKIAQQFIENEYHKETFYCNVIRMILQELKGSF